MTPPKHYQSAVRENVLWWIEKIKRADILVGIPCYNSEETIGHVVAMVAQGLRQYFADQRTAILVSDGGSLDDTREEAYKAPIPEGVERRVTIYRGLPGKGTSVRAIFEVAGLLDVRACAIVDSDLKSITPDWIRCLVQPVLSGRAEFVAPYYRRHKFDGTITNQLIYPLTRALYGLRIRQPIGGDFGFSRRLADFYARQDVWLTDVARFGIDIWMTTTAISQGVEIVQADLGVKRHNPKDPSTDLGPMFCQVISTLFYLMGQYEARWRQVHQSTSVPLLGCVETSESPDPVPVDLDKLRDEFIEGFDHFAPLYQQILDAINYAELADLVESAERDGQVRFSAELWARVVYDFAFTYQTWSRNRRRLVDIMVPLYFGRTAAYCQDVYEKTDEEAEAVIESQAETFETQKSYLLRKFEMWEE